MAPAYLLLRLRAGHHAVAQLTLDPSVEPWLLAILHYFKAPLRRGLFCLGSTSLLNLAFPHRSRINPVIYPYNHSIFLDLLMESN